MRRPALLALPALLLAACSVSPGPDAGPGPADTGAATQTARSEQSTDGPDPVDGAVDDPTTTGAATAATTATAAPADPGPLAAALALVPADTAYLTVTDWAAIKDRLGAGELTSESIQTDRTEFWRGVGGSTVLLTEGALRPENSRLGLRYGVTQDDARWELRWVRRGSEQTSGGLALRLRDDLDLAGLERAVEDAVPGLEGAHLAADQHLLLRGAGEQGATLAADPARSAALARGAESQVVAGGCVAWSDALGVDATVEDQEAVAGEVPLADLLDPDAWGLSFAGRSAAVVVVYPEGTSVQEGRTDAGARLGLAEQWPTTEAVGWADAFGLPPGLSGDGYEVAESGGRVLARADYRVVNPTAAATVALAGTVPWAVCSEIDWLATPTGR